MKAALMSSTLKAVASGFRKAKRKYSLTSKYTGIIVPMILLLWALIPEMEINM
jgi:hypothetical protein